MGLFLSLTSIVGQPEAMVKASLAKYAQIMGGGFEPKNLPVDDPNRCVIQEANGNTTIVFPYSFMDWQGASEFLSKELKAPVFSFHIHDSDLWMYTFIIDGEIEDMFNPIPDYWEDLDKEDIEDQQGDAEILAEHINYVRVADIENYLVRWDLDMEGIKAYPDDEYNQEEWQLLDFMRKLRLPYPLDDDGRTAAPTYKFWVVENE